MCSESSLFWFNISSILLVDITNQLEGMDAKKQSLRMHDGGQVHIHWQHAIRLCGALPGVGTLSRYDIATGLQLASCCCQAGEHEASPGAREAIRQCLEHQTRHEEFRCIGKPTSSENTALVPQARESQMHRNKV